MKTIPPQYIGIKSTKKIKPKILKSDQKQSQNSIRKLAKPMSGRSDDWPLAVQAPMWVLRSIARSTSITMRAALLLVGRPTSPVSTAVHVSQPGGWSTQLLSSNVHFVHVGRPGGRSTLYLQRCYFHYCSGKKFDPYQDAGMCPSNKVFFWSFHIIQQPPSYLILPKMSTTLKTSPSGVTYSQRFSTSP